MKYPAGLLPIFLFGIVAYSQTLSLNRTQYTLVAGARVTIDAPAETLAQVRSAKARSATAAGRTFAISTNIGGDAIVLGAPLAMPAGDYSVRLSLSDGDGNERATTLKVTVKPLATPAAATTPLVLLDGFQLNTALGSGCPQANDSTGTFDNLQALLAGPPNAIQPIYFFENCTECPGCTIEQLGSLLGEFLNSLPYPQVDVVAHSMGGLIVRSYLAGKAVESGAFNPPVNPKIRKAVFVASPNFGAFAADFPLAQLLASAAQIGEMQPGSQFIWDLGTWNQFTDDLRGVDAISIVGTAGPSGQSDGVVESTSASLDFWMTGRTRVVNYCHVSPGTANGLAGAFLQCEQPGIAYVDTAAHPTYRIVSSFLSSGTAWESVGIAPSADSQLSQYGGLTVTDIGSVDQFVTPASVTWGSVSLAQGGASELYYDDFVSGSGTFQFGSSPCGPWTATAGIYSLVRCKATPPVVQSVGPLLAGAGKVVEAGGTITITGSGFGTQCAACGVAATNLAPLQVVSWTNTSISAALPASFGAGIVPITVIAATGGDTIHILTGLAGAPTIGLSPSILQFAYTLGGAVPSPQTITVSNIGSGNLSYTASSSQSWLVASTAGTTITASINPQGLAAGTYPGVITVVAAGATDSPQTIAVSLVVSGTMPSAPSIAAVESSATGLQGSVAPGELISIYGANLGPSAGASFSLDAAGMVAGSLAGTQVTIGGVGAPILYTSNRQINAIVPYEVAGQAQAAVVVQYGGGMASQTVQLQAASPGAFTLNSAGTGEVVAANQDVSPNGAANPAAKGSYVTIYWTGGGQTNPAGVTGSVTSGLKWLTQSISVTVGNQPAMVSFDGSAPAIVDGVDQLNIQLSPNTPSGAQPVLITVGGFSSPAGATLWVR